MAAPHTPVDRRFSPAAVLLTAALAVGCPAADPPNTPEPPPPEGTPTGHTGSEGTETGTTPPDETGDTGLPAPPTADTGALVPPTGDTGLPTATGDTGAPVPTTLTAACALTPDNTLRAWCSVTVDPAQPVEIAFQKAAGGPVRVHRSDDVTTDHIIGLYLMAPQRDYTWTARVQGVVGGPEESGTVRTLLPPDGAQTNLAVLGSSTAPYVLLASPCRNGSYGVIMGTQGEVLWYEEFESAHPSAVFDNLMFTEDQTIMGLVTDKLTEVDLMGRTLLEVTRGVDVTNHMHHDAFRKDGYTYVLFNESLMFGGWLYDMDGFYVLDAAGTLVDEWHLADVFTPPVPPVGYSGRDYSHANSIWVAADRTGLVSFRHLSAVVRLNMDPESPLFGDVLWRLSGDPSNDPLGSDFTLSSSADGNASFVRQHNAHFRADGRLALFDNRQNPFEPSRLLALDVDLGLGLADIAEAYQLPMHCAFQGGAWHTAAGDPMATCAPQSTAFEYPVGDFAAPSWTATASCITAPGTYTPRFVPLDI